MGTRGFVLPDGGPRWSGLLPCPNECAMTDYQPRPLRAATAAVVAAALALAGCAGGLPLPWASTGSAAAPVSAAVRAPMARGPFVAAANPLAVEAGL